MNKQSIIISHRPANVNNFFCVTRGFQSASEIKSSGVIRIMEAHYTWDIDEFPSIRVKSSIKSPRFFATWDGCRVPWFLTLYPNGHNSDEENVGIFLGLETAAVAQKEVQYTFSCIDSSDHAVKVEASTYPFTTTFPRDDTSIAYGTYTFLLRETILNEKHGILIDGHKLRIHCCVTDKAEMPFCLDIGNCEPFNKNSFAGFWDHYQQRKLVDCAICVGPKEFKTHKIVLAARSKVFSAIFESDFIEKATNTIRIEDFEPKVVEAMINFIYQDVMDEDIDDICVDLLVCAEKYQLNKLKFLCARRLARNLSVETAARVLVTAHLCDVPSLRARVVSYVADHWREVVETASWEMVLRHKDLIKSIFEEMNKELL